MIKQIPIIKYNVRLEPARDQDIERIRRWRNSPFVQRNMQFQEYISPEMQKQWWANLSPFYHHYFLVYDVDTAIGVIHLKDINWDQKEAEAGIFIGKKEYLGTFISVQAVLALMDTAFEQYGLKKLKAKVATKAEKTLDFNQKLGYEIVKEEEGFAYLEVDRLRYENAVPKLKAMAMKFGNSTK